MEAENVMDFGYSKIQGPTKKNWVFLHAKSLKPPNCKIIWTKLLFTPSNFRLFLQPTQKGTQNQK